eukprot:NODE_133_length_18153_cov_0.298050.p10 type:complete len:199 gc:universal NODE_133_length_18153_cov_0.298050:11962-11366(-)
MQSNLVVVFIANLAWCFATTIALQFGVKHGWVFFAVVYNILVSVAIIIFIKQNEKKMILSANKSKSKALKLGIKQLLYVLSFLISVGYSAALRFAQFFGKASFEASLAQAVLTPLQGFWNCLIYLYLEKSKGNTTTASSERSIGGSIEEPFRGIMSSADLKKAGERSRRTSFDLKVLTVVEEKVRRGSDGRWMPQESV